MAVSLSAGMRETTRSSVESSLTIKPFSICPGEEVEVEVLMENPGVEISQIEFELTLPTGIEAEEGTAEIYDLCGCKVTEPVKGGIYIINGKKVVVNK